MDWLLPDPNMNAPSIRDMVVKIIFFTIQDFISHPEGSQSAASLPEILWIGSMHGNERLGPTVVMEAATLLLEAASCEAKPSLNARVWKDEVAGALSCRSELRARGVDETHRQWLARLVTTRRIVVVPNANSLGYYRNEHLEDVVDPAEDFPYNIDNSESCMRTVAARTLNEIFRTHMFQFTLLFKEGDNEIHYSWGSQAYLSPDDKAYGYLAESLSHVVGGDTMYPYGTGNSRTIDPTMSFQDWAYAASWERPRTVVCDPRSYGGYDEKKTSYLVETNRALAFTISSKHGTTLNGKQTDDIGDVFHAKDDADSGLAISRNMRLALVAADLAKPYISIFGINSVAISEDAVPSNEQAGNLCDTSRIVAVPGALDTVIVEWTVGGALDISQTDLWVARVQDIPDNSVCSMSLEDGFDIVKDVFKMNPSRPGKGKGFFSKSGPDPSPMESVSKPFSLLTANGSFSGTQTNAMGGLGKTSEGLEGVSGRNGKTGGKEEFNGSVNLLGPVFRTEIDLSDYDMGDRLILIASATVDQEWLESPEEYHQPIVDPQSHLVNMRTNPGHEYEISGKKVQGRLVWLSIPVTVVVDDVDKHAGGIELFKRLDESSGYAKPPVRPTTVRFGSDNDGSAPSKLLVILVSLVIAVTVFIMLGLLAFLVIVGLRRKQADLSTRDGIVMKSTRNYAKNDPSNSEGVIPDHIKDGRGGVSRAGNLSSIQEEDRDGLDGVANNAAGYESDPEIEPRDVVDFESLTVHSSYPAGCSGGVV